MKSPKSTKRLFKSMAEAETAYSAKLKEADLYRIATNALFTGDVVWHDKARAKRIGMAQIGWARLDGAMGGILIYAGGTHVNGQRRMTIDSVGYLDDVARHARLAGLTDEAALYEQAAVAAAEAARSAWLTADHVRYKMTCKRDGTHTLERLDGEPIALPLEASKPALPPRFAGTDVLVTNHGSIVMFHCQNERASAWLREKTSGQWMGEALAVEPRYVLDLASGMSQEGFVLGGIKLEEGVL